MSKIYLVWERDSYCDYDVILITNDKEKAQKLVDDKNTQYECERCWVDERVLNVGTVGRW